MIHFNNKQKNKIQLSIWRCCIKECDLFYERMCSFES